MARGLYQRWCALLEACSLPLVACTYPCLPVLTHTCLYLPVCVVAFSEVQKAVQMARGLYQRWCELLDDPLTVSKEEYDWTTNELRNSLRSIEWDLEDLEETINILCTTHTNYTHTATHTRTHHTHTRTSRGV